MVEPDEETSVEFDGAKVVASEEVPELVVPASVEASVEFDESAVVQSVEPLEPELCVESEVATVVVSAPAEEESVELSLGAAEVKALASVGAESTAKW